MKKVDRSLSQGDEATLLRADPNRSSISTRHKQETLISDRLPLISRARRPIQSDYRRAGQKSVARA
jgi:hypothetical protein